MTGYAIQTQDLGFAYDSHPVFNGLSLEVPKGSVYGLWGATAAVKQPCSGSCSAS